MLDFKKKVADVLANALPKVFPASLQRYELDEKRGPRSILDKLSSRALRRVFKFTFTHSNRRGALNEVHWGGDGGFMHAVAQSKRQEEEWYPQYGRFFEAVKSMVTPETRIIEIGCSAGQWVDRLNLTRYDCGYYGIDINPKSIEYASAKYPDSAKIRFECADILNIASFENCNLFLSCQTMFFIDITSLRLTLGKLKSGTMVILQEPVNQDYAKQKTSVQLKSDNILAVGFSHNYSELLGSQGFDVQSIEKIEDDKTGLQRVLIRAMKNG